ncbi:MAG: flippase-like domain-containing protein [Gammaproteobacteria bacterium]|nr:flippase-like domain-containing protein [Gammaproteobacteria bacterium]
MSGNAVNWRRWLSPRVLGPLLFLVIAWNVDWPALLRILVAVPAHLVVLALALQALALVLKTLRWRSLLHSQGYALPVRQVWPWYLVSSSFGVVTPARLGEAWKAFMARDRAGVPLSSGLSATLLDRLLDMSMNGYLALAALLWISLFPFLNTLWWSLLLLVPLIFLALLFPRIRERPLRWLLEHSLARKLGLDPETRERLVTDMHALFGPRLALAVLLTLLSGAVLFFQFGVLLVALDLVLEPMVVNSTLLSALTKTVSALPVSVAGVGTRDAVLVVVFRHLDLAVETAVGLSVLLLLVNHVGVGVFGTLAGWWDRRTGD